MDNLINIFMNYKINRLTEYGVLIYNKDSEFIRYVFSTYFKTYVDNYYYNIFNTIEDNDCKYNSENLQIEFDGIMIEMLDEYRAYELQVSNEEYDTNRGIVKELNHISLEILKMDALEITDKDHIYDTVLEFVNGNKIINEMLGDRVNKLVSLVRETYMKCSKLLNYTDTYYSLKERQFLKYKDKVFIELEPNIKVLDIYRKSLVNKIFYDDRLEKKKLESLIQKVSLVILKNFIEKNEQKKIIIEFHDSVINRGKFDQSILKLIDNPMIRDNVIIGVNYNTYLEQIDAFSLDYQFACIQDYSHINDVYQKTENIYNEAIFNCLIVSSYKFRDRDFFINYENDAMEMLVFEEE